MCSTKLSKDEFDIKLLSGNNVVLVESNCYESEIFMPVVQDGRIIFQNIIPNRRCCGGMVHVIKPAKLPRNKRGYCYSERLLGGSDKITSKIPLANSTPLLQRLGDNTENISISCCQSSAGISPEPLRCAAKTERRAHEFSLVPNQVMLDSIIKPKDKESMKLLRLYRRTADGAPRKVARIVASRRSSQYLDFPDDSGYQLPSTPQSSIRLRKVGNSFERPTLSSIQKQLSFRLTGDSPKSVTKWRQKVKTPKRTYSRRSFHSANSNNICNLGKNKRYNPPSYLANPTLGPKPSHTLDFQRRHLIVDKQMAITPRTFKRQQNKPIDSAANGRKQNTKKLPISQNESKKIKATAFDLLTNSNKSNISSKLNNQFRAGCLNKGASTYPSYQLMCKVPTLDLDAQTRTIERINANFKSALAKQVVQKVAQKPLAPSSTVESSRLNKIDCKHQSKLKDLK